jgi:hypothetical protein
MSLSGNRTRLIGVTKELMAKWEHTRESWKDAKCLEFERTYLKDLMSGVDKAATVMEQLDKLISKVRSDCG